MLKIVKDLVSKEIINSRTYGYGNTKKAICIHETDNERVGADSSAHALLQKRGNDRQASWHYTVDEKQAIQSFEHGVKCWASGDVGNNQAIHIEMCVHKNGNYEMTVENTAILTAKIMTQENISIKNVVQHNFYTGKNCPRKLRQHGWNDFIKRVLHYYNIYNDNNLYYVQTGTYSSMESARMALEKLKKFGWKLSIEKVGEFYRIKTGVVTGYQTAFKVSEKIKENKIASVTHIVKK